MNLRDAQTAIKKVKLPFTSEWKKLDRNGPKLIEKLPFCDHTATVSLKITITYKTLS